jgi:hypothetical protein
VPSNLAHRWGFAVAAAPVCWVAVACVGGGGTTTKVGAELPVPDTLIQASWPMQVVDATKREPFESDGFVQLIKNRDYRRAIQSSQGQQGLMTARFHADAAALYRQAALATANAYVQYFDPPLGQAYDPEGKEHVLLVGKILRGDLEGARAVAPAVRALPSEHPATVWAAPWLKWLDEGAVWPPDLSGLPDALPEVVVGQWPEVERRPSYALKERQEEGSETEREIAIDDPALLVRLALWHDQAAVQAAPEHADALATYGARYRWAIEPHIARPVDLPLELLVGSDYLTPSDAAFMAAVHGSDGLGVIDTFQSRSLTAAAVVTARAGSASMDGVKAVDFVSALRLHLRDAQSAAAGQTEGHHPVFADVVAAGLYRNLAYVAELEGNREVSGTLRIAARDIERDAAAAPEGLMALTAWDADNQYTIRGSEIIHQLVRRAPSLEVVRTAFDLIGIRVSRSRGGGTPGM